MNAWLNRIVCGVLWLLTMGAAGCTGGPSSSPTLTIDEEFTRMAQEVPGFGGYYYDEAGDLNVVLTQPSVQAGAIRSALSARRIKGSDALVVQRGQFGFGDLSKWRARLDAEQIPGLVFTDVDEVRNRITVGMDRADRGELLAALARHLIPEAAVNIEDAETPQEHQTAYTYLHWQNRPLAGGLQISRYLDGYIYYCTLGFNARVNDKLGFFTNTHCTNVGTIHYQGYPRIGVTTEDPLFWSNRSVEYDGVTYTCAGNEFCRFSDAAFAEYDAWVQPQVKFGYIFRTETENAYKGGVPSGIEHLKIDEAQPFFRIVGKAYHVAVGETVHKMGQRTGWTSGKVTATCVNSRNGNTRLFCQMWGGGMGYDGDSGSPVFRRVSGSDSDVELAGIYWGTGMSPIGSVEQDFGPLDVVGP